MSVEALIDDALPTPPDASDSAEIVGFLRRFSNLISTGQNAGNLRRAAALIELLADRASEAERLLGEYIDTHAKYIEMYQTVELMMNQLTSEAATLKAQLEQNAQQARAERTRLTERSERLSASLEQAQAPLGVATAELETLRNRSAELDDACVMVPIATLRALRDQFEFVSNELAIRGGVVAQAMSEIGRCAIEQTIVDARAKVQGTV
jgi:DNA repair exonuclease SbcCD ATPase subunit